MRRHWPNELKWNLERKVSNNVLLSSWQHCQVWMQIWCISVFNVITSNFHSNLTICCHKDSETLFLIFLANFHFTAKQSLGFSIILLFISPPVFNIFYTNSFWECIIENNLKYMQIVVQCFNWIHLMYSNETLIVL